SYDPPRHREDLRTSWSSTYVDTQSNGISVGYSDAATYAQSQIGVADFPQPGAVSNGPGTDIPWGTEDQNVPFPNESIGEYQQGDASWQAPADGPAQQYWQPDNVYDEGQPVDVAAPEAYNVAQGYQFDDYSAAGYNATDDSYQQGQHGAIPPVPMVNTQWNAYNAASYWSPTASFATNAAVDNQSVKQLPRSRSRPSSRRIPLLRVYPVQSILFDGVALADQVPRFPGPLIGGKPKLKKKDVIKLAEDGVKEAESEISLARSRFQLATESSEEQSQAEDYVILWKLVKLLLEQDGVIISSKPEQSQSHLRDILYPQARQAVSSLDMLELSLMAGDRKGAVNVAMNAGLIAHALVISAQTDKENFSDVVSYFSSSSFGPGADSTATPEASAGRGVNPVLLVLFSMFGGRGPQAAAEFLPSPGAEHSMMTPEYVSRWRDVALGILANRCTGDMATMVALGEQLRLHGRVAAAHACFLLSQSPLALNGLDTQGSRVVLLGVDHLTQLGSYARNFKSLHLTELYEYSQTLIGGIGAAGGLPHLQAYKLVYAHWLADHGFNELASRYCEAITHIVNSYTKGTPYFHRALLDSLKELIHRVSTTQIKGSSDAKESGNWLSGKGALDSLMSGITRIMSASIGEPLPPSSSKTPSRNASASGVQLGSDDGRVGRLSRPNSTPSLATMLPPTPPIVAKSGSAPFSAVAAMLLPEAATAPSESFQSYGAAPPSFGDDYAGQQGQGPYYANGQSGGYNAFDSASYGAADPSAGYQQQPDKGYDYNQGGFVQDGQQEWSGHAGQFDPQNYEPGTDSGRFVQSEYQPVSSESQYNPNGYEHTAQNEVFDPNMQQSQGYYPEGQYTQDEYGQNIPYQSQEAAGYPEESQGQYDPNSHYYPQDATGQQGLGQNDYDQTYGQEAPINASYDSSAMEGQPAYDAGYQYDAIDQTASTQQDSFLASSNEPQHFRSTYESKAGEPLPATSLEPPAMRPAVSAPAVSSEPDFEDDLGLSNNSLKKAKPASVAPPTDPAAGSQQNDAKETGAKPAAPANDTSETAASSKKSASGTPTTQKSGLFGFLPSLWGSSSSKSDEKVKKADLGGSNALQYDAKLGRWVMRNGELPSAASEVPPPPMATTRSAPTSGHASPPIQSAHSSLAGSDAPPPPRPLGLGDLDFGSRTGSSASISSAGPSRLRGARKYVNPDGTKPAASSSSATSSLSFLPPVTANQFAGEASGGKPKVFMPSPAVSSSSFMDERLGSQESVASNPVPSDGETPAQAQSATAPTPAPPTTVGGPSAAAIRPRPQQQPPTRPHQPQQRPLSYPQRQPAQQQQAPPPPSHRVRPPPHPSLLGVDPRRATSQPGASGGGNMGGGGSAPMDI
ncbi:hypothetical protein HK405_016044, partial [Cladochytrium tenue]